MITINTHQLTKQIGKNIVLSNIDLSLNGGNIYGFVGKNGSGKTMLFRTLSGLVRPTSGQILINKKELHKDIKIPKNLGLLIENIGLYPEFTGLYNLKLLADINKKINIEKIKETITLVGLDPNDKRPVKKYSLGMKQRIALAQAIMEDPEILMLDEPTNALDENGVALIRDILSDLRKKGALILIASHNKDDINMLCNYVNYMENGLITKTEILDKLGDEL